MLFVISLSLYVDIGRQDGPGLGREGGGAFDTCSRRRLQLKNVRGGSLIYGGAFQLQTVCGIDLRYCNEYIVTVNCNGLGGL